MRIYKVGANVASALPLKANANIFHPACQNLMAELFKRKPRKSVEEGLLSLAAVGRAENEKETGVWYSIG